MTPWTKLERKPRLRFIIVHLENGSQLETLFPGNVLQRAKIFIMLGGVERELLVSLGRDSTPYLHRTAPYNRAVQSQISPGWEVPKW
jgi:hypothetical protein